MDSISQVALGAGVGEVVLGKKIGNKAMLLGAIAGTLPDLDVFVGFFTKLKPEEAILVHRSYSHAAVPQLFFALPFATLTYYLFKKEISFIRWYLLWYLCFLTHTLLDCCTTYGTQLFLPFTRHLVGINNVSVVDPLYTIPFLVLLGIVFFLQKGSAKRIFMGWLAIVISTAYLGYATINKFASDKVFKSVLKEKNININQYSSTPTMFTSWLWNMLAVNDSVIYVGEYSVFQKKKKVDVVAYQRNTALLDPIKNTKPVETLLWFSQGNYFVEQGQNDTLLFYNIKWGRGDFTQVTPNEAFRFYFMIFKNTNGEVAIKAVEPDFKQSDFKNYISMIHRRVFSY